MPLHVETIVNSPITSNCFVISDISRGSSCIVIDPGTVSCIALKDYLNTNGIVPEYVILTHEHFDHIAGVPLLRKYYNFQLVASKDCSNAIQNPKTNLSFYRDGVGFIVQAADIEITGSISFEWCGYHCEIYPAKGHSIGGIITLIDGNIFTGDTLLWDAPTVTKLPTGSKDELRKSVNLLKAFVRCQKLHVYAGHGIDFDLSDYKWNAL